MMDPLGSAGGLASSLRILGTRLYKIFWPCPRQSLFWRVYLHSVTLLLSVAIAIAVVNWIAQRTPYWRDAMERASMYMVDRYSSLWEQPSLLQEELQKNKKLLDVAATIYDVDGRLLYTNIEPPIELISSHIECVSADDNHIKIVPGRMTAEIRDSHDHVLGYVVARTEIPTDPVLLAASSLFMVLGLLALLSIPLVRGIVAPVEQLTISARRLGEGRLSERSGIRRSDEVGQLAYAFDEMAGRLETLLRAEKEILANISHELRTPLTRTRIAVELAASSKPERAAQHLAGIAQDLDELERLVDDVLTSARLELAKDDAAHQAAHQMDKNKNTIGDSITTGNTPTGISSAGFRFHQQPVLIGDVLRRSVEHTWQRHPECNLNIDIQDGIDELPPILGDAVLLRRAIDNLIDNAHKYSPENAEITLRACIEANGSVKICVQDQGIGVDEEDVPKLFTPFFRTDKSRQRGTGGVGLGLLLVKRIVEAHGGTVCASSQRGAGTTMCVTLPMR